MYATERWLKRRMAIRPSYTMQDVFAEYAYSSNYDGWKDEKNTNENLRDFINDSRGGFFLRCGC